MNILDLQDKLKNLSEQQLVQEMQMPTGQMPQFLVLSEITRRKKMRDAFAQEQMKDGTTTVAQDVVAAAGMPAGFAGQMAGAMAPQTDMGMNSGAMPQQSATPAPVQGMAGGGIVALKEGGRIVVRDGRRFVVQPDGTLLSEDESRRVMTPRQNIARDAGMLREAIGRPEEGFQESFDWQGTPSISEVPPTAEPVRPLVFTGGPIDSRSGLERMEQEQETSMLTSTSPTIRALRLSEIGGNIGDFVNEVGLDAIRQADALVAAGASLGGRATAGGTAALGALASVLGFPDTGAMLERTANTIEQKRRGMMDRADGEGMPFGLPAGRVFTSPEQTPFTVPQETRNMYTQAEVLRRLGNTPDDSPLFAEGRPNERLSQQYDLLPGSTGPSPMAGVMSEMPNLMQGDPRPLDRLREPSPTSPGYFSAPDVALTGRPSQLPTFDVSTGVPLSVEEVESAAFPTQADLDMRYGAQEGDRFPGEARVESERQAAITPPTGAARDLDAFLSGGVESLPTGVDAVTDFAVDLADRGVRGFGNLMERALATGQSKAAGALDPTAEAIASAEEAAKLREDAGITESLRTAEDQAAAAAAAAAKSAVEKTTPKPPAPPGGGGIAAVAQGAGAPSDFEQELLNMLDAREKRATQDKWLALAQAGMALMSSKAPTFGEALGEAGTAGLGALREGQSGAEADRLALLGQIEQSRMGRAKLDLDRQALAARSAGGDGLRAKDYISLLMDAEKAAREEAATLAPTGVPAPAAAGQYEDAIARANALRAQYGTLLGMPVGGNVAPERLK